VAIAARPRRVKRVLARVARLKNDYERLAEDCARMELELTEHAQALEGTALDLLEVNCRTCSVTELERLIVQRVMLLPMWVKIQQFIDTLEMYKQLLIRVVRHRGQLAREVGRRQWLCEVTGRHDQLESWRVFLRLGGCPDTCLMSDP
jgi:hypothetical protein